MGEQHHHCHHHPKCHGTAGGLNILKNSPLLHALLLNSREHIVAQFLLWALRENMSDMLRARYDHLRLYGGFTAETVFIFTSSLFPSWLISIRTDTFWDSIQNPFCQNIVHSKYCCQKEISKYECVCWSSSHEERFSATGVWGLVAQQGFSIPVPSHTLESLIPLLILQLPGLATIAVFS